MLKTQPRNWKADAFIWIESLLVNGLSHHRWDDSLFNCVTTTMTAGKVKTELQAWAATAENPRWIGINATLTAQPSGDRRIEFTVFIGEEGEDGPGSLFQEGRWQSVHPKTPVRLRHSIDAISKAIAKEFGSAYLTVAVAA